MPTPPADIALLLRRAGFGGSRARIEELAQLELPAAVEAVLDTAAAPPDVPPARLTTAGVSEWDRLMGIIWWWLDRMATSPAPIVEKMTLFWHGHFTTSYDKVFSADWLYRQNRLYRTHALGDYHALAQGMAVEPAMLDYLDNASSRKEHPNQNFARELLELFLLGVGNYSEADVVAAARAWTGHSLDWGSGQYVFRSGWHDYGTKTFLGHTGNFDGPDIISLILQSDATRPVAARFICRKLWEFFAHPGAPQAALDAMAAAFVSSNLEIKAALRAMFLRPEFYAAPSRQGRVRSPIEYVVAVLRSLGVPASTAHPEWWLQQMGQMPLNPPDVSGWKHNSYWLSTAASSAKADWAVYLTWELKNAHPFAANSSLTPDEAVQRGFDALGITEPSEATRAALRRFVTAVRSKDFRWAEAPQFLVLMMLTPDLQLG